MAMRPKTRTPKTKFNPHLKTMYPHIINRLRRTPWAATPATIEAVRDLLNASLAGTLSANVEGNVSPMLARSAQAAAFFGEGESQAGKPYQIVEGVAVIPVFGVIGKHLSGMEIMCGGLDVDELMQTVDSAAMDDAAESILLWFNSPGGTVTGLPEAASHLAQVSDQVKTVFAYTDGMCCSAAYWLASQCEGIFASPSSDVGSIGVYLAWLDQADAAEKAGYHLELIKAGEFKAMGHPLKHLTDKERAMLQEEVDEIYTRFKAAVTGRRAQIADSTMQGQTFSFDALISTGLVDALHDNIGSVIGALAAAESPL